MIIFLLPALYIALAATVSNAMSPNDQKAEQPRLQIQEQIKSPAEAKE